MTEEEPGIGLWGSIKTDRGKEICSRPAASGDEEGHTLWDGILGERMYDSYGLRETESKSNMNWRLEWK